MEDFDDGIYPVSRGDDGLGGRSMWKKFIQESGPYDVFLTLGFRIYLDDRRAVLTANHFLLRMNRSLYGKRFEKHGNWMSGIAVIELKRRSLTARGSPHFHFLLRFPNELRVGVPLLGSLAAKHASRLRYPTHQPERPMGTSVSGPRHVKVVPITDMVGLARYVTKELSTASRSLQALSIGFVGPSGIDGIEY